MTFDVPKHVFTLSPVSVVGILMGLWRVMRQVTNTTPVCWGSCGYNGTTFEGPLTALGPAWGGSHYAAGMSISFDVFLEAEARLELRLGRAHGVQL